MSNTDCGSFSELSAVAVVGILVFGVEGGAGIWARSVVGLMASACGGAVLAAAGAASSFPPCPLPLLLGE